MSEEIKFKVTRIETNYISDENDPACIVYFEYENGEEGWFASQIDALTSKKIAKKVRHAYNEKINEKRDLDTRFNFVEQVKKRFVGKCSEVVK